MLFIVDEDGTFFKLVLQLVYTPVRATTLTKQADVHLLQGVNAAELVQLVVDLVEYQRFVVVRREVSHYVIHCGGGNNGSIKSEMTANIWLCWSLMCPSVPSYLQM